MAILNESWVMNKKNMEINLQEWKREKNKNILFVTGLSGSGKTTLAEEYEKKYKAFMFEIDGLEHNYDSSNKGLLEKAVNGLGYSDFMANDEQRKSKENVSKLWEIFDVIISTMSEDHKNLYIIEGIQLFDDIYPDITKGNKPIIIMGSSTLTSILRRFKRNAGGGSIDYRAELNNEFFQLLGWYGDSEKRLGEFRKSVKKNYKESTILSEASTMTGSKRKEMMTLIYSTLDALDKTGTNHRIYEKYFEKMTNDQFDKWCDKFFKDPESNIVLDIDFFDRAPMFDDIRKAAKIVGCPLEERVAMPWLNPGGEPIYTPYPVPVMYLPVRRVQQLLNKKNAMSTDISKRNPKTGQVMMDSKNARMSDVENIAMLTIGSEAAQREGLGPRADSMKAKTFLYNSILTKGYADIDEIPDDIEDKTSLLRLDVYMLGAGVKTNLVTDGLLLLDTLKKADNK